MNMIQKTSQQDLPDMSKFNWEDPLRFNDQLSEEETLVRISAERFEKDRLMPRVIKSFRDEISQPEIFKEMGESGLLGINIPEEYGGLGSSYVSYGLVAREIEKVDSGYRSMMSVQSSLVMYPIYAYGSEEQRRKYLPRLATGDLIGCFGLTESDAGSDPSGMQTVAKKTATGYQISGSKMWISNSPFADIFIVWAKSEYHDNKVKGFIIEKGLKGLSAPKISGKLSLRTSMTRRTDSSALS